MLGRKALGPPAAAVGAAVIAYFAASAIAGGSSTVVATSVVRTPASSFATGIVDINDLTAADYRYAAPKMVAAGATYVKVNVDWGKVAPAKKARLRNPGDPGDPAYTWSDIDTRLRRVVAAHLTPVVEVSGAPVWSQGRLPPNPSSTTPPVLPSATEFGTFVRAVAERYSGHFRGLPRVRYWSAWNEPDLTPYVSPQFSGNQPVSPGWYRDVLNSFYAAVKGVSPENVVIAGNVAPFRDITGGVMRVDRDWGPIAFMRDLFCLSSSLRPTCDTPVRFDVWAVHPYTSGGPNHHAVLPNDVSLADLAKVRKVLDAAMAAGHIVGTRRVALWITEFDWDSKPPDPNGVPLPLLDRWVPLALYRAWQAGVSVFLWTPLRDLPLKTSQFQGGLYFLGSSIQQAPPKPILALFRFPAVALRTGDRSIIVWGRAPERRRETVRVEQSIGGVWHPLGSVTTGPDGVFQSTFATVPKGSVRILSPHAASRPYSLKPVPDKWFNPFGFPSPLEPRKSSRG